jgi:uncharacterized protein
VKRLFLGVIHAYQRWISPRRPRRCKYEPTCSAYAVESIERYGALRGSLMASWRLLRCNPFSHGGFDPVPNHFRVRANHVHPADHHREAKA